MRAELRNRATPSENSITPQNMIRQSPIALEDNSPARPAQGLHQPPPPSSLPLKHQSQMVKFHEFTAN